MAFRYKPNRLKYKTTISTLDETHQKIKVNFENNKKLLPLKIKKIEILNTEIEKINNKNTADLTSEDIEKKIQMKEQINHLNEEINDITNFSSEMEYYSKTTQILLDYYDIFETNGNMNNDDNYLDSNELIKNDSDEKNISENTETISTKLVELNEQSQQTRKIKKETKKRQKFGEQPSSKCILDFFDSKNNTETNASPTESENLPTVEKLVSNKASLFDEYMSIIDKNYVSKKKTGIIRWCNTCGKEMTLIQSEGSYNCLFCGLVDYVIIESEIPNYKESGNEKPAYPYKRVNHLIECLNQFQAKESTEIPNEIYNEIMTEIRKTKTSTISIAFVKMKNILKKLRLNQYYEHIPHIISKITGKPAPTLNIDVEDEIKNMFKKIQKPFSKYCPKDRTNFLSYSYVLHKFFQLLGLDEFLSYFPLLKSREKLRLQDKIWKNICDDLHWPFMPSI
jgi:hypothetical protein